MRNLAPTDFARALRDGKDCILIDVRTPEEYRNAHLPGAINISYLSPILWEQLEQLDDKIRYFVYCRTERRSMRVCMLMQNGGFKQVYNLDGGLIAWEEVFGQLGS
ncbi:MAG: rhodanese-like domain-containing protein [Phaeodactylibacter sp.]|nr:rhodanese-like domain-containing protein [Phaeodactylibacter sp.]